jgi:hypothetical protein
MYIYISREPRRNWDPHPLSRKPVCLPGTKEGREIYDRLWVSLNSQFGRLEKKPSTLSSLWKKLLFSLPVIE